MASTKLVRKFPAYNIVLVGKTGHGKSATGNTILDRKVFKTNLQLNSGTGDCQLESAILENAILNVIDTPGLMDTERTTTEIEKKLIEAMSLCPDGFHAFLFVVSSIIRFTEEEKNTLNIIKSLFGPAFIKVCIIVFTRGDAFDMAEEDIPFDKWVKEQTGEMAKLIQDCENRWLLFYNTTRIADYKRKRQETVTKLLHFIETQKMLYTDGNFKTAVSGRIELIKKNKLPQLNAKYQCQLSLITSKLENISDDSENVTSVEINVIKEEFNKMLTIIDEYDKGSEVSKEFRDRVTKLAQNLHKIRLPFNKDKLIEYVRLLKNPPNKIPMALAIIATVASVIGAVAVTVVSAPIPPVAFFVGAFSTVAVGQAATLTGKTFLEYHNYREKLKKLETELEII